MREFICTQYDHKFFSSTILEETKCPQCDHKAISKERKKIIEKERIGRIYGKRPNFSKRLKKEDKQEYIERIERKIEGLKRDLKYHERNKEYHEKRVNQLTETIQSFQNDIANFEEKKVKEK